jgi:hypothetical protein
VFAGGLDALPHYAQEARSAAAAQPVSDIMYGHAALQKTVQVFYPEVISDICDLNWSVIDAAELTRVAWAYYHFSVQFRENLKAARELHPDDEQLEELDRGERNTDNLSPWSGVAAPCERMDHDEFMRRTLELTPIEKGERDRLEAIGRHYLDTVRSLDETSRALSIASYEDGGLEKLFEAMLQAPRWDGPLLQAFRHFLIKHIEFDSDPDAGHGALCRHLTPDDRVLPFWIAFETMLLEAVPRLASAKR